MAIAKIEDNKVVSIHYTLRDDAGEVIDSSEGEDPLVILFGLGDLVPGLERALAGRSVGEHLDVIVPAADGYGERSSSGGRAVPRDAFPQGVALEEGMCFDVEDEEGEVETFWVTRVDDETVHIDLDHPLAGQTLHFSIDVVAIRDATPEELDHGHVH